MPIIATLLVLYSIDVIINYYYADSAIIIYKHIARDFRCDVTS